MDFYKELEDVKTFHKEEHKKIVEIKEKYKIQSQIISTDIGVTNGNTVYYGFRKKDLILNKENIEIGYIETFSCKEPFYSYIDISELKKSPVIFNKSLLNLFE